MACLKLLLGFLCGLFFFAFPQRDYPDHEVSIEINATPITAFETENPSRQRFGALDFRGGLVLTSTHKSFGGFSGLRVEPDGERFVAVSDRATWLRGRMVYQNSRPIGIVDAFLAPVLDAQGMPGPKLDTESLAEDGNTLYIGLERIHSILRFEYGKLGVLAPGNMIPVPPEMKNLPNNQSLEALVFVPKMFPLGGTLIAFSEHGLTEEGNLKAFLVGGPTPGMFAVKRTDGFDISDAVILPDGDILVLERQYSIERGVAMRIRRLRLADIKPGALVDGTTVIDVNASCQIDNMEAMSMHRTPSGEIILTVMSDDNLSALQRTVLLQFILREK